MTYNPFNKEIGERLSSSDLQDLVSKEVAEGYFIECKRQLPKPIKIARSIASLANTYGGWYFVGIETDEHHVIKTIDGFPRGNYSDPISVIRETMKQHIEPVPVFFASVIELGTENLVLVVNVPGNQDTPFITSDGRLYRRTHDSSDPVPETSRYALDQLVERGRLASKRFAAFAQDSRTYSKADGGWVKIFISPLPFGAIERNEIIAASSIRRLLARSREPVVFPLPRDHPELCITVNMPFNAAQTTAESVILKQVVAPQAALNPLSVELDRYGRAKLLIPIMCPTSEGLLPQLKSHAVRDNLLQQGGGSGLLKFFDMGRIWLTTACLINFYIDWLGSGSLLMGFRIAYELDSVWRFVAFCDNNLWADHVHEFGLPVMLNDSVRFPQTDQTPYEVPWSSAVWVTICRDIALAFGLQVEFFAEAFWTVFLEAAKWEGGTSPPAA